MRHLGAQALMTLNTLALGYMGAYDLGYLGTQVPRCSPSYLGLLNQGSLSDCLGTKVPRYQATWVPKYLIT